MSPPSRFPACIAFFIPHSLIPFFALLVVLAAASSGQGWDRVIDSPMYREAELMIPPGELSFPAAAKELWLRALERPEADMKCQAAQAISLAHRDGIAGFQSTIPALQKELDQASHPVVRLALAEALITLEAREAADRLLELVPGADSELGDLVEPALARWDHRPARQMWLARLNDSATPTRSLLLAIRCLAAVREQQAALRLRSLAVDLQTTPPVQVEAARALGWLRTSGLEKDADSLVAQKGDSAAPRLAAAALLRQHGSQQAIALLKRLLHDPEPAVASLAAARLFEVDFDGLVPEVEYLLGRPEPSLRLLGVAVLRRWPTEKAVRLLGDRLSDEHVDVRVEARDSLRELADEEGWRNEVLAAGMKAVEGHAWEAQEQGTVLLTQLNHKPAADRLLDLLTTNRPEVYVTAGWGLRKLAVPNTLPAVLRHVIEQQQQLERLPSPLSPAQSHAVGLRAHSLSQLIQFMGLQRYTPADATLRHFVYRPQRPGLWAEARAAAIWALGLMHEGEGDRLLPLVMELEARLSDTGSIPPEDGRVRMLSAFCLGLLKAEKAIPTLQQFRSREAPSRNYVSNACGWAIEHMKGRTMPPPRPIPIARRQWFLTPLP
jgi:HEAT repeat protein